MFRIHDSPLPPTRAPDLHTWLYLEGNYKDKLTRGYSMHCPKMAKMLLKFLDQLLTLLLIYWAYVLII